MFRWCWRLLPLCCVTWMARRYCERQLLDGEAVVQPYEDVLVRLYPRSRIKDLERYRRRLKRLRTNLDIELSDNGVQLRQAGVTVDNE
jgi:hypothetical protein